jgi:thiol-disulfide isomerase/thioredoxin
MKKVLSFFLVLLFQFTVFGSDKDTPYKFKINGVDGKVYDLEKMRGEVVLISFGATWCAPCATELQLLEKLKAEYKNRPVKFLWVSIESVKQAPDEVLVDFVKSLESTIPVLRDKNREVYSKFSPRIRLPLVALFDKTGKLAGPVQVGFTEEEIYKNLIRRKIDALLTEAAVADNTYKK